MNALECTIVMQEQNCKLIFTFTTMDILFNFSGVKSFEDFIRVNKSFYYTFGNHKSFSFFKASIFFIDNNDSVRLLNEYNCAIAYIQMFDKWIDVQKNKELFPYLQFDAVIDGLSHNLEKKLNGIIKHVDDPFWDVYFPLNFKSDRSTVRQLINAIPTKTTVLPKPEFGFIFNVGKPFTIDPNQYSFIIHNFHQNIDIFKNRFV